MTDHTLTPATDLETATPALDFSQPLLSGDPRWVDLSPARGNDVRARVYKRFMRKQPGRHLHVVFASHRGAGKTTELNRLAHDLRDKYCCLYLAANVELDAYEIVIEDLLLLLCREVERYMREDIERPLPDEQLARVTEWFAEAVSTTVIGRTEGVEAKAGAKARGSIGFVQLFGEASGHVKVASEHRDELRSVLRRYPGALDAAVNTLFNAAHRLLKTHFGKELLLVIDNLDRYPPEQADQLLIMQADRLCRLKTNLILTPPISLHYRPRSGMLTDHFTVEVMPSVKLRDKDDAYARVKEPARTLLLDALRRRIDLERLIPDEAACDALIIASGGSIRELLDVTQYATLEAEGAQITPGDAERARAHRTGTLRSMVYSNGWAEVLGQIAETKEPAEDPKAMDVLFHRLAFKYNGEEWYDVHPALAGLPEVVAGLKRRAATAADGG